MTQPLLGTLWQFFVERKRDRKKEEEFCFGTFLVTKQEGPEEKEKTQEERGKRTGRRTPEEEEKDKEQRQPRKHDIYSFTTG